VGFRTVDILAERFRLTFKKPFLKSYFIAWADLEAGRLYLVKPLTYMNRSGDIFPDVLRRTGAPVEEILVVCDTLDLPVGECRIKRKGSSAGHKGLTAIIQRLGRHDIPRLYIGVGRPNRRTDVVDYVLSEPRGKEANLLDEGVHTAAAGVLQLMEEGLERVMNVFNRRTEGS
jgi:PTH1 family peptidyl-tRNA hydrolase